MIPLSVPPHLVERSWEFASLLEKSKNLTEWCAPGRRDDGTVAFGKMAECGVCDWVGLDPVDHLDWFNEKKRGEGHDVEIGPWKIEVKHTFNGSRLIWPYRNNDKFERLDFNCLALVVGTDPDYLELRGVIRKARFFAEKIESKGEYGIKKGTWYVERLADPERLLELVDA